jgi:tRNA threonylcarbamoyladenosine biosynthesis protein TsaE
MQFSTGEPMMEFLEFTFSSRSDRETVDLGRRLGGFLKAGCTIGLIGDLGAGKTCFIKGMAEGLNNTPADEVTSPTFTILQEYPGAVPLYHFDAYRLCGSSDLEAIGFNEYIGGDGVAVIEWADRISDALPPEAIIIRIDWRSEHERLFTCVSRGAQHRGLISAFCDSLTAARAKTTGNDAF